MREVVFHEFPPVFDQHSKILILGSIPSRKSREIGFYYGHPGNRFWAVLEAVFNEKIGKDIESKKAFLFKHHIALWDVLASCSIEGSKDESIKDPVCNDFEFLFRECSIDAIFTTGKKAFTLYETYCKPKIKKDAILLPSTSPLNIANYTFSQLVERYSILLDYVGSKEL